MATEQSLSIANPHPEKTDAIQKLGLGISGIGIVVLFIAWSGVDLNNSLFLTVSLLSILVGTSIYAYRTYMKVPEGIKNNGVFFNSMTRRGTLGWIAGIILTGFYVCLYFWPKYLGLGADGAKNTGFVALFDPLSQFLKGEPASQWFLYGTLYTVAILAMGIKFILKYRHSKYHIVRTISVMFFQLGFAFLLPEILLRLNYPYNDFKNMWPLNYYFFDEWNVKAMINSGSLGMFMLLFGIAMIFIISPVLTFFYGKRWYCSWVCGCGGLAETAGDPYRQLSDKSLTAWKIERYLIHTVLIFSIIMTVAVVYSYLHTNPDGYFVTKGMLLGIVSSVLGGIILLLLFKPTLFKGLNKKVKYTAIGIMALIILVFAISYVTGNGNVFYMDAWTLRKAYGFYIGSIFSGVIGVGLYPLLGNRVWCRFGCPMAAILGLQQRFFSKFRITTNGGQCISCGNCSTYCEQGIDVRAYAQKGQNIVRASCVGCGICAAVCPRGVLKLENGPLEKRIIDQPEMPGIKK